MCTPLTVLLVILCILPECLIAYTSKCEYSYTLLLFLSQKVACYVLCSVLSVFFSLSSVPWRHFPGNTQRAASLFVSAACHSTAWGQCKSLSQSLVEKGSVIQTGTLPRVKVEVSIMNNTRAKEETVPSKPGNRVTPWRMPIRVVSSLLELQQCCNY